MGLKKQKPLLSCSEKDFLRVFKVGRRFFSPCFKIFVTPVEEQKGKLGISISAKLAKAHDRNRIKRLIREALRIKEGSRAYDWIFVIQGPAFVCSRQRLLQEIHGVISKL